MRVKGPGDGTSPIREIDRAGRAQATEPAAPTEAIEGAAPVEALDGVEAVEAAAPTAPAGDPALAVIAGRLRAGELSAAEAVELIIEDIVDKRAGSLRGDRRLADELKALLRRQAETDPYLASRVRRMGKPT